MAQPEIIDIDVWIWEKVATGVTSGFINRLNTIVYYYQTYRDTGEAAPDTPTVGTIPEEAVRIFDQSSQAIISATSAVDVYIMCANIITDSINPGSVRVDL